MNDGTEKIIQELSNKDYIFHYTSFNAAKSILESKQIWLSRTSYFSDYFENMLFRDPRLFKQFPDSRKNEVLWSKEIDVFRKAVWTASFCTNKLRESINPIIRERKIDRQGFSNFRMWDQYADGYRGVCLIFSKRELKKANKDCKFKQVHYSKDFYNYQIKNSYLEHTSTRTMMQCGYDPYCTKEEVRKILENSFITKHFEYKSEQETRCIKYALQCSNKQQVLNIESSLVGAIMFEGVYSSKPIRKTNKRYTSYKKQLFNCSKQFIAHCKNVDTLGCSIDKYCIKLYLMNISLSGSNGITLKKYNSTDNYIESKEKLAAQAEIFYNKEETITDFVNI